MTHYPSLAGRVAIVTGGGRGLGRVMALALVAQGADVVITGARSAAELEATVEAAAALRGGRCAAFRADVADPAACREAAHFTAATFGPAAVLVNNAARGAGEQPGYRVEARPRFWETDAGVLAAMLASNVGGPWFMAAAVVPGMIAQGFGRIVNISTSRPTMLFRGGSVYGPAKAALEACTRIWAEELAGTGVTANVLLPGGASDTALIPGEVGARAAAFVAGKEAPGREGFFAGLLPPEIMAPPLLWLASDDSDGVTGRRFVARDWDADLTPAAAATRAEAARIDWPHII